MRSLEKIGPGDPEALETIRARLMSREDYEAMFDEHMPEMGNELVLEVIRPDGEVIAPLGLVMSEEGKLFIRMYADVDSDIMDTSVFEAGGKNLTTIRVQAGYA